MDMFQKNFDHNVNIKQNDSDESLDLSDLYDAHTIKQNKNYSKS